MQISLGLIRTGPSLYIRPFVKIRRFISGHRRGLKSGMMEYNEGVDGRNKMRGKIMTARKHRDKPRTFGRAALWGTALLGLGAAALAIVWFSSLPPPSPPGAAPSRGEAMADLPPVRWTKGNPRSSVTLVEYSDFQCPTCGQYYPMLKQLGDEFHDQIRFVYRQFPLTGLHRNAMPAALAAEAAGRQGRFWEMHNLIFEHQKEWSDRSDARERFIGYAKELGLDITRFEADMDAESTKKAVEADMQSGFLLGVNGTPTFFLNGVKLQNPRSYDAFRNLIQLSVGGAS
jgi:protein-disulfide isomerase